jgi:hypothetical protein
MSGGPTNQRRPGYSLIPAHRGVSPKMQLYWVNPTALTLRNHGASGTWLSGLSRLGCLQWCL